MKNRVCAAFISCGLIGALVMGGCTQMPTEKQSISDIRPQISFKATGEQALGGRVLLDGLEVGVVEDYVDGLASLRILSGTHLLRVVVGNQVVLDEKFYAGDGTSRTFILK